MFSNVMTLIELHNKRTAWIETLPKKEANRVRENDALNARAKLLHINAIEVAAAGRARNFWGN